MKALQVEVIPIRPAVRSDAPTLLDVLIKISPPHPESAGERPRLNLGLVIDRSGSMGDQRKINYAREAASFAVQQLLETDRISLTIFDDHVETIFQSAEITDKSRLIKAIEGIQPGGSTDLHGGWAEGARQVKGHLVEGGLNRVLLLSDGLANVGVVQLDAIATAVSLANQGGVSTTAMGLGDDYNEDLLEAMAQSGLGNYYYIENPKQLPQIFATELQGLVAAFGSAVTLGIDPASGAAVADVLNDFEKRDGAWVLPNLVAGMPVYALVRLNVPPMSGINEIGSFRIAWLPPGETERQEMTVALALPGVASDAYEMLAPNLDVQERVALYRIGRLKKEATSLLSSGDKDGALAKIAEAKALLASLPPTDETRLEAEAIALLDEDIAHGDEIKFLKRAKYQRYTRSQTRTL